MSALTDPKRGRTLGWAGDVAVRTVRCGGSDPRWAGMAPEVTKNKSFIPVKRAFAYDARLNTSQPHPWGTHPKFSAIEAAACLSNLASWLLPLASDLRWLSAGTLHS